MLWHSISYPHASPTEVFAVFSLLFDLIPLHILTSPSKQIYRAQQMNLLTKTGRRLKVSMLVQTFTTGLI